MRPIATKLDQVVVYSKGFPPTESSDAWILRPDDDMTNGKRDRITEMEWKTHGNKQMEISTSVRPMATKVDKVVI